MKYFVKLINIVRVDLIIILVREVMINDHFGLVSQLTTTLAIFLDFVEGHGEPIFNRIQSKNKHVIMKTIVTN